MYENRLLDVKINKCVMKRKELLENKHELKTFHLMFIMRFKKSSGVRSLLVSECIFDFVSLLSNCCLKAISAEGEKSNDYFK